MKCDRELAELTAKVCDLFGRPALVGAHIRALAAAPAADVPPELEALLGDDPNIKVVTGAASASALKSELRRMLTATRRDDRGGGQFSEVDLLLLEPSSGIDQFDPLHR